MDVNKLIDALDNENNEKILNLTTKKIKEMNMKILTTTKYVVYSRT